MNVLEKGHGQNGEGAEADLDPERAGRYLVGLVDPLLCDGAAILRKLVERRRQLLAAAINRIVQLVEGIVCCTRFNGRLEIDEDRLLQGCDVSVIAGDQAAGFELVGEESHFLRSVLQLFDRFRH